MRLFLHVPPAPRGQPESQHVWSGTFASSRPQRKETQTQQPSESPALTVDPWALGALGKEHTKAESNNVKKKDPASRL